MMMYYGGLMMRGWVVLGLMLAGLFAVVTLVALLGGVTWLQRQERGTTELRALPIPGEDPHSVIRR